MFGHVALREEMEKMDLEPERKNVFAKLPGPSQIRGIKVLTNEGLLSDGYRAKCSREGGARNLKAFVKCAVLSVLKRRGREAAAAAGERATVNVCAGARWKPGVCDSEKRGWVWRPWAAAAAPLKGMHQSHQPIANSECDRRRPCRGVGKALAVTGWRRWDEDEIRPSPNLNV